MSDRHDLTQGVDALLGVGLFPDEEKASDRIRRNGDFGVASVRLDKRDTVTNLNLWRMLRKHTFTHRRTPALTDSAGVIGRCERSEVKPFKVVNDDFRRAANDRDEPLGAA